jgi:hypothetical protein
MNKRSYRRNHSKRNNAKRRNHSKRNNAKRSNIRKKANFMRGGMEARVGGDTVMDQLGKIVTAELDEAKGRILATAQRVLEISEHALLDIGTVWSRSQLVEDLREFLRRYPHAGDTPSEFMVIGNQRAEQYDTREPGILITSAPRYNPGSWQTRGDDSIECQITYDNKSYKKEIIGILTEVKILEPPVETR